MRFKDFLLLETEQIGDWSGARKMVEDTIEGLRTKIAAIHEKIAGNEARQDNLKKQREKLTDQNQKKTISTQISQLDKTNEELRKQARTMMLQRRVKEEELRKQLLDKRTKRKEEMDKEELAKKNKEPKTDQKSEVKAKETPKKVEDKPTIGTDKTKTDTVAPDVNKDKAGNEINIKRDTGDTELAQRKEGMAKRGLEISGHAAELKRLKEQMDKETDPDKKAALKTKFKYQYDDMYQKQHEQKKDQIRGMEKKYNKPELPTGKAASVEKMVEYYGKLHDYYQTLFDKFSGSPMGFEYSDRMKEAKARIAALEKKKTKSLK